MHMRACQICIEREANELTYWKSLFFVTEVTTDTPRALPKHTGLDSAAALRVMSHLRAMASGPDGGHTVLASVHQPRCVMNDVHTYDLRKAAFG